MPVPLSGTDVTAGVALEEIWSVVARAPTTVGANATLTRHESFGATGSVQRLVIAKSPASPPESWTSVTSRGAVPVLVTVTSWSARPKTIRTWPKSIDDGEAAMAGASVAAVDVALSGIVSGAPKESCGTVSVAERGPEAVAAGWNVTEIWQVASVAVGCAAQPSFDTAKSAAFGPLIVAAPGVTALGARFVIVTVRGALVVPAARPPKFTEAGEDESGPASLPVTVNRLVLRLSRLLLLAPGPVTRKRLPFVPPTIGCNVAPSPR